MKYRALYGALDMVNTCMKHETLYEDGELTPYIHSLLDDCSPTSKEPMYGLFHSKWLLYLCLMLS